MAYTNASGNESMEGTTRLRFLNVDHRVGRLLEILKVMSSLHVNMTRVESKPKRGVVDVFEITIDFDGEVDHDNTAKVVSALEASGEQVAVFGVPWFPRTLKDLDHFSNKTLDFSDDVGVDHPGFNDAVYRARRTDIVKMAKEYRHGQPLPVVDYTDVENATWSTVYDELKKLHATHACRQYNEQFEAFEKAGIFKSERIPQLQAVSNFLASRTGWTLRPVQGLLSPRDFLNGLALRVFHATQYIRHASRPFYTPEPDVCHELLGHVPLFSSPSFSAFSQQIGLASLGATDRDIERLATCYWFTVEFGICKQSGDELRAYGAGLLSSFGELKYCLGDTPQFLPFEPLVTCNQGYVTTSMQPIYFVAESFDDATARMKEFAATLERPFHVEWDPISCSVDARTVRSEYDNTNASKGDDASAASSTYAEGNIPQAWC
jgi:phenylalanine-4-hydroxylase